MVEVEASTPVTGENGKVPLIDVFEGRRQLVVYYHMWHNDKPAHARDVTYATFTEGPTRRPLPTERFMGYKMPWYSAQEAADVLLAGRCAAGADDPAAGRAGAVADGAAGAGAADAAEDLVAGRGGPGGRGLADPPGPGDGAGDTAGDTAGRVAPVRGTGGCGSRTCMSRTGGWSSPTARRPSPGRPGRVVRPGGQLSGDRDLLMHDVVCRAAG